MSEIKLSKLQENKLSTFEDIETILDRSKIVIERIPQFSRSVITFKEVVSDITKKAVLKTTVSSGKTVTKTGKRLELETVLIEVSSSLYVFGVKNGNEVIKSISSVTQTSLDRLRDTEIVSKAVAILETVEENEPGLVEFGISADDISKLRNCISNYKDSKTEKSESESKKSVVNISLSELFKKGMDTLENEIDRFVNSLRTKENDFYNSYYAIRTIKNLGIRHKKQSETQIPPQN